MSRGWKSLSFLSGVVICILVGLLYHNKNYDDILLGHTINTRAEDIIENHKKRQLPPDVEDNMKKNIVSDNMKCEFGFEFLEDLMKTSNFDDTNNFLLPSHKKQNFSGALVTRDLMCLDTMDSTENQWLGIFQCHGQGRNQAVRFTTHGFLQTGGKKPLCISIKNMIAKSVILKKCNPQDETQLWTTNSKLGHMKPYTRQDHCLTVPADRNDAILIEPCNVNTNLQKWQLIMREVLSLLVSENSSAAKNRKNKRKRTTSKQVNKILLQKPTEKSTLLNDIFLF